MSIEEKLGLLKYKNDRESHISVFNHDICANHCKDKPCIRVCPAKVYEWNEESNTINVNYENCIECGAARMICPFDNISWEMPKGGYGVSYKYG